MNIKTYSLLIIITLSIFSSCKNDLDEIRALTYEEDLPNVTVEGLNAEYSINAVRQVKLLAPLAYRYTDIEEEYSLFPNGITLNFYNIEGDIHSSLRADYGIYFEKKGFAKAKGNVILTNTNKSVLKTEELYLDEKTEKIYTDKLVNIKDEDGFEITGKGGFESNLDFTVYRFTDVSGNKILDDDEEKELMGREPGTNNSSLK
jgi:LPS export ABC transporter protein LptC